MISLIHNNLNCVTSRKSHWPVRGRWTETLLCVVGWELEPGTACVQPSGAKRSHLWCWRTEEDSSSYSLLLSLWSMWTLSLFFIMPAYLWQTQRDAGFHSFHSISPLEQVKNITNDYKNIDQLELHIQSPFSVKWSVNSSSIN